MKKFSILLAALKGNDTIIKKLFRLPAIKRFEEDEELLEDLIIENNKPSKQQNYINVS